MGPIKLEGTDTAITLIHFVTRIDTSNSNKVLDEAAEQLNEYFEGQRKEFDLPLAPEGTEFQQKVWTALQQIPFGHSTSYGHLADTLGDIKATRAVGTANGQNPIGIVIPCHRVIGSKGELTGYAGGLHRKKWLLEHEGILPKELF